MKILVVNPKGGSGKTTMATHLAGFLARRGEPVVIHDLDVQGSSAHWLSLRSAEVPKVYAPGDLTQQVANHPATYHVYDSPAAYWDKAMRKSVNAADIVVVPVPPSVFDIAATRQFLDILRERKAVRKGRARVALVGMRVNPRTLMARDLSQFLSGEGFPVLTFIRDTQRYPRLLSQGLCLFDREQNSDDRDIQDWQPFLDWMDHELGS